MAKTIRKRRAPQTGLIVSVILAVVLIGGGAYAWFSWLCPTPPLEEAEEAMRKIMTAIDIADIKPLLTKRSLRPNGVRVRFGDKVQSIGWEKWATSQCRVNAMSKSWPSRDIRCSVSVGKATLKGREAWVPVTTAFDGRGRHSEQTQEWVFVCQQSHWRLDVEQNMQRFADEAKEGFEKLRQDLGYEAEE